MLETTTQIQPLAPAHLQQLLTVADAAREANCHEESIRRAYRSRQLAVVPFGRRNWRVRRSDLLAWQTAGMKMRA